MAELPEVGRFSEVGLDLVSVKHLYPPKDENHQFTLISCRVDTAY